MKLMVKRALLLIAVFFCLVPVVFTSAAPAFAAAPNTIIRKAPVNIPEGEKVESIVVLGHNATIAGTVKDTVFVINGDVQLTSTSRTGLVIAIGGTVKQDPGAQVTDTALSLDFDNALLNSSLMALIIMVGLWGIRLALSTLLVLIPLLIAAIVQNRLRKSVGLLKQSPIRVGTIGLIAFVLVSVVSFLVGLTVIGLPVATLLLVLLLAAGAFGFTAVSYYVGDFLLQDRSAREDIWFRVGTGSLLLTALGNIPLLGWILLFVVMMISIGVAIVQLWQRRPKTS